MRSAVGRKARRLVVDFAANVATLWHRSHRGSSMTTRKVTNIDKQLRTRATELASDPEHAKWVTTVREQVARGIPAEERVGKDELLRRKRALRTPT